MEMNAFFKSVVDQDPQAIVICDPQHIILYMNPAAREKYAKRGYPSLVGHSVLDCHAPASREHICRVVEWFAESPEHNLLYTFHKMPDDVDLYMIALRDENGRLIGYYEKHESRVRETRKPYDMT